MVKNELICLMQSRLVDENKTCGQEKLIRFLLCQYKYWRLNWWLCLSTTYLWSNRSYHFQMNSISRGPRPAVSYFQTKHKNVIIKMGRNLLLNSINIGLETHLYMKNEVIYRPNYCTINNLITPSTVTLINSQLVNIWNVARNLSSCEFYLMK